MAEKNEPSPRPKQPSPRAEPTKRPQYPPVPRVRAAAPPSQPPPSRDLPVIEDDDAVIVPAPGAAVFAASHAAPKPASPPSLFFRRTMIPILLTTGVTLAALGGLWFTLDRDAPLRASASGIWLPATLFGIAAVMLILAILNMLQVRHLMRQAAAWRARDVH